MARSANLIDDSQLGWLKESLLVINTTDPENIKKDVYAGSRINYSSTEPGGMIYMNPLPQACRYSDLRVPNRLSKLGTGSAPVSDDIYYDPDIRGLGNIYDTVHNANSQIVHFRWGVPAFNSLSTFWSGFYNRDLSSLTRNGKVDDGLFSFIGSAIGTIFSIPFVPFIMVGKMWRFFTGAPANKYWYVQPAMPLLWTAINTMTNHAAVNLGIIPRFFMNDQKILADSSLGINSSGREEVEAYMKILHDYMPNVFREDGGIDVYRLASRATALEHKENEALREIANSSTRESLAQKINEYLDSPIDDPEKNIRNLEDGLTSYMDSPLGKSKGGDLGMLSEGVKRSFINSEGDVNQYEETGLVDLFLAELRDGSAFISYRVNHTGPLTESFSNSSSKPEIFDSVNERSRQARSKVFSFAGGNFGDGVLAGSVEGVVAAVGNLVGGTLESIGLDGLAVAAGAAFASTQELWEESVSNIPEQTYTIDLNSISADPLSLLLDIYIPLFSLMAPALPRSTGSSSYTGPFVGEMFDEGKCISRNCMISSMSIERGTGDVGWSAAGHALNIRVTMTVKDLNTVLHMPIAAGWSFNPAEMLMPDDTPFNDYMSAITNLSLRDVVYPITGKLPLNIARAASDFRSWASLSRVVNSSVNGNSLGRMFQGITREFDRSN